MARSKKSTSKSGSTTKSKAPTKSSSSAKSKTPAAEAKETVAKVTQGKGKVLAASAGVAAAAVAAGVAYFRGTRSTGGVSADGRTVYHVLPASEGWQVKGEGAERAVSNHGTKKEALSAGRELAHGKIPSQLVVHKSDGTIQESWSYESD